MAVALVEIVEFVRLTTDLVVIVIIAVCKKAAFVVVPILAISNVATEHFSGASVFAADLRGQFSQLFRPLR